LSLTLAALRSTNEKPRRSPSCTPRRALDERAKLLEAHYANAIPLDLLKVEQERIARELKQVEERLAALELHFEAVEYNLKAAFQFIGTLDLAYAEAPAKVRRQMNQALFSRILVSDDGEVAGELRPPFQLILQATGTSETGLIEYRRAQKRHEARLPGLVV
jgi:site-specific DNA recombinase